MAEFIEFIQIQNTDLSDKFLNDHTNSKLAPIIKKNKKNLAVKINKCKIPDLYLVIVRGKFDNILVKLGRECGFPRGFPILWSPNNFTRYFGFLPKFANDERQVIDDFSKTNIIKIRVYDALFMLRKSENVKGITNRLLQGFVFSAALSDL